MRTARAFVPGHVTGIFRIFDEHENLLRRGSMGAGFSVKVGTVTSVSLTKSSSFQVKVEYNGREIDGPVTMAVINRLLDSDSRPYRVEVNHDSSLPIGVGFGASGAGALGTALALSWLLGIDTSVQSAGVHAHVAEVVNHSGLGDVIAQCSGGVETRIKPGAPGIGEILQIPYDETQCVVLAGRPGLETKEVLTNPTKRERINDVGDEIMKDFLRNPTFDKFVSSAKKFSNQTGLMTAGVDSALDRLHSAGFQNSSMVMLGDSVFSFCNESEVGSVVEILSDIWDANQVIATSVSADGGRLV
ncbi:MAG: pantoate kinase [Promethearchaeota archaeon]